jgi:hypothetical protein
LHSTVEGLRNGKARGVMDLDAPNSVRMLEQGRGRSIRGFAIGRRVQAKVGGTRGGRPACDVDALEIISTKERRAGRLKERHEGDGLWLGDRESDHPAAVAAATRRGEVTAVKRRAADDSQEIG